MDKQRIFDILTDTDAEHRHADHELEKAGLEENGEAYRRWKRVQEWYLKQINVIREVLDLDSPDGKEKEDADNI